MKHIASLAAIAALLAPFGAAAMSIHDADMLTGKSITDRLISGELKPRVIELFTNLQTGVRHPAWELSVKAGLIRHCGYDLSSRKVSSSGCDIIKGW